MSTKNRISMAVLMTVCLMGSACVKRSVNNGTDSAGLEGSSEFTTSSEADDFNVDEGQLSQTESFPESTEVASDTPVVESTEMPASFTETSTDSMVAAGPEIQMAGSVRDYVVKKNDTLMLVAHNIYGDHLKWKELKELNKSTLGKSQKLTPGSVLKYYEPATPYVQEANGEPYLIVVKDTLGVISGKVYQTPKRWKDIWKNNPYIKNPNLIFAGFTLYYVKDDKLANRM